MQLVYQMVNFYAVKVGIKPGIYLTWKECENNVKNFTNAKYKKFNSKNEAQSYINDIDVNTKKESKIFKTSKSQINKKTILKNDHNINEHVVNDNYNFENCINVYTDGGCLNNGNKNAIAGCGIYFAKDDKRNTSLKLKNKNNYNATNNRAELKAILHAIKILKSEIEEKKNNSYTYRF